QHGYTKAQIKDIQKIICAELENNYSVDTNDVNDNESEDEPDEFLSHMYKRNKSSREPKEFQKYLNHPLSNAKVDILDFWRSQKAEFPQLSKIAKDYLSIQGGSVPVERDFSMGADLVTPKRCSLHPNTIRGCMCLKSWLKEPKRLNAEASTVNNNNNDE
ncbi:putative AC transposase, partial [Pseudolycoriella hygida]